MAVARGIRVKVKRAEGANAERIDGAVSELAVLKEREHVAQRGGGLTRFDALRDQDLLAAASQRTLKLGATRVDSAQQRSVHRLSI